MRYGNWTLSRVPKPIAYHGWDYEGIHDEYDPDSGAYFVGSSYDDVLEQIKDFEGEYEYVEGS